MIHGIGITLLTGIGLAVIGWGINIKLVEKSPFLPWVGSVLIFLGSVLVLSAIIWLVLLIAKRFRNKPVDGTGKTKERLVPPLKIGARIKEQRKLTAYDQVVDNGPAGSYSVFIEIVYSPESTSPVNVNESMLNIWGKLIVEGQPNVKTITEVTTRTSWFLVPESLSISTTSAFISLVANGQVVNSENISLDFND